MKTTYGFLSFLTAAAVMILAACTSAPAARDGDIVISGQGFFASGGTVTEPVPGTYNPATNWLDPDRPGNTAHVDHANTFFQIPSGGTGAPMVFLHGYGQSRNGWLSSPDGGEAWAAWFLRQGHPVFLVDQPRRASAGNTVRMTDMELDAWGDDMKDYKPGDQAWYTHFRIGRVAPERYEGSQFPAGAEAQNQFFRQMTPNTGNYDEALFGSVLGDVMEDVSEMTGKKAVYVTHSQGSRVGWKTPVENIAAIVAVEPGGAPEAGSAEYRALLAADIPVIFYFGDYIDNGPADIRSTEFWRNVRDGALAFAEAYNRDGGDATVIDLPKIGITGNSHFLFQEKNNAEIAARLEAWLAERGLD